MTHKRVARQRVATAEEVAQRLSRMRVEARAAMEIERELTLLLQDFIVSTGDAVEGCCDE